MTTFSIVGDVITTIISTATLTKYRRFVGATGISVITLVPAATMRKVSKIAKGAISGRTYICTITGAENGLDDLIIPVSTINIDHNFNNKPTINSSIMVVCPNGVVFSDGIIVRKDGNIIITATEIFSNGDSESAYSPPYPVTGIQSYRGSRNFSVSIFGGFSATRSSVNSVSLTGFSFKSVDKDGGFRVRVELDKDVLPGDIVTLPDNTTFNAGNIAQVINPTLLYMEVTKDA